MVTSPLASVNTALSAGYVVNIMGVAEDQLTALSLLEL